MSHQSGPRNEPASAFLLESIDQARGSFEGGWRAGQRPRIEEYLGTVPEPERSARLHQLLCVELAYRRLSGEAPSFKEYYQRFPSHGKVLALVFRETEGSGELDGEEAVSPCTRSWPGQKRDVDPKEPDQPARLGRYRITGRLGKGSFGIVYKGYDDDLQREVAIKVPYHHSATYLREGQILAKLDHPHIVPVFDVGTDNGRCFIVSKYIEGSDLATRINIGRPAFVESAAIVATVAEALYYAHRRGLIHRDIKPGNILLDKSGQAFVADFGLALKEEDLGKESAQAGTPSYMSPEQARGEGHRVDGRSDLYSLGVVFYELLTGRRPLSGRTIKELLDKIAIMEPCPPRQLEDAIPKELERICLKALCKRAAERYTTGKEMGDDLRFWLAAVQGHVPVRVEMVKQLSGDAQVPPPSSSLGSTTPTLPSPARCDTEAPVRIIPKGLRAFDADDADFFLELLPGPRDRNGLPDSLRFWKNRIEETDAEKTFPVGLLYGPSGCGKSSLMRAGLLPRLAGHVIALYIEATPAETEARLLKGLRRNCSSLPGDLGLKESLTALRRGRFLPAGKKVLIVLDQFEQWLQAKRGEEDTELVQALRHCDGEHVQCILMARDDFWMAATRFMDALEVPLVQGSNTGAADLFDPRHAKKVLTAYGRAFKALPERDAELTKEHVAFLEQAVAGLSQEGKVISVRLALFAQTLRGRPWTPATLRQVGGIAGVGVTFLEETFASSAAPPLYRRHQKATQAVLKILLPETGADIKGKMRSRQELLRASGYSNSPRDFKEMLRILDGELRLITPTDPEGVAGDGWRVAGEEDRRTRKIQDDTDLPSSPATRHPSPATCYYQLTHDYLVPALRFWLARKQKETRRGRAELRLAERAAMWNTKPENRYLPAWWEWANIRLFTRRHDWTASQQAMMKKATRYYALWSAVLLITFALLGLAGVQGFGYLKAQELTDRLLVANTNEIPAIVAEMAPYRRWLDPRLREAYAEAERGGNAGKQLHLSLAFLPVDAHQRDYLYQRLLGAEPSEVVVIRQVLAPHQVELLDSLWRAAEEPAQAGQRLRAACGLALYAPRDARWEKIKGPVAADLASVPTVHLATWMELLRPVRLQLLAPLASIFGDRKRRETERSLATDILADYAADQPGVLAHLLLDAEDKQFAVLYPKFKKQGQRGLPVLEGEIEKKLAAETKEEDKERLAKRQANAAVALLRGGRPEKLWPLLQHSSDARVRSYVIDRVSPLGGQPTDIVKRLEVETDVSIRRALVLILGEFSHKDLPASERERLLPKLLALYREDPDPGLHGAVAWLLQQWGRKGQLQQIDQSWAKDKKYRDQALEGIRRELANHSAAAKPGWFVNSKGQTFAMLPGPVQFLMGSPATEARRGREEILHPQHIGRTFALSMTHVTVQQFKQCIKNFNHTGMERCPDPDCPILGVSWYMAAFYCNWLSLQDGLPRDQWCYLPNQKGQYAEGMRLAPDYLQRTGYRLPTEAEWEYACRAGAVTSRYFGSSDELLEKYAWYAKNSAQRTWPVGLLKPNDFGLFDMQGQVEVWCEDEHTEYGPLQGEENRTTALATVLGASAAGFLGSPVGQPPLLAAPVLAAGSTDTIKTGQPRVLRGGDFNSQPESLRSAYRLGYVPTIRLDDVGFRLARTIRP